MKKERNTDQQKISDLLKKLQASYLGNGKTSSQKEKESDTSDKVFQKKLAGMLGKVADPSAKKSKKVAKPKSGKQVEQIKQSEKVKIEEDIPVFAQDTRKPDLPENSIDDIQLELNQTDDITPPPAPTPKKTTPKNTTPKKKQQQKTKSKAPAEEIIPKQYNEERTITETTTETPIHEQPETTAEEVTVEIFEKPVAQSTEEKDNASVPVLEQDITNPEEEVASEKLESSEDTEAAEPERFVHPLENIIPLVPPQADNEVKPEQKEKPQISYAREQKSKVTETAPANTAKKIAGKHTITIATPSSTAPDFQKLKDVQEKGTDAIVIRPRVSHAPQNKVIVIRPRNTAKATPAPQLIREENTSQPIRIGKEVSSDPRREPVSQSAEMAKSTMKKEQNTTFIPPTSKKQPSEKAAQPKATAKPVETSASAKTPPAKQSAPVDKPASKKPGISMPRTSEPKGASTLTAPKIAKKATHHKAVATKQQMSHPEDDNLEEVLDESLNEEEDILEEIPVDEPEEIVVPSKKLSFFQRRQQQKQQLADQKLSAMEVICKKSGLTEDDIAMIFELGYENELGRLVGYENLKRLKSEHLKRVSQSNQKHYRTAFGYRGEEYADTAQYETIKAAYIHDRKKLICRLLLTALLTVVLLILDMPSVLGTYLTTVETNYPKLLPLFGMLGFALTAWLSFQQIKAGLRSLFRFSPTPYSVGAVLSPVVLLYDLASLFAVSPMLKVNFLAALTFLLTAVCDTMRLSCEMRALRILSASDEKTVLAPATPRKKKLRQGEKIVKIISDDLGENLYQVKKAKQTVGFFRRFNEMGSASRPFTVLIYVSFALATLLAFADAVATSSLSSSFSVFMTALTLSLPMTAMFGFFYPLSRANRILEGRNCTLVGEEAIIDYDESKTLIFSDTDLFTTEKKTEISVRKGSDLRQDLYLAGVLFRKLGGTLQAIAQPKPPIKNDPPVAIVRIQEIGVEAMIDNKHHMLMGNAAFLKRSGIRVPTESTDKTLRRTNNISLMYIAVDGLLKLSYEIEYTAQQSFEKLICELADSNTAIAVNSYDPNLNESFLQKCRPDLPDPVSVVKPGRFEEDKPMDIVDTGAVALGQTSDIAYPIHAAHGISVLRKFGFRMQLIATLIGSVSVFLLTLFGKQDILGILPIAGYQGFWILVAAIATRSELNGSKLHFD